ncbi:MAG: amidohydrolase [Novosphingobium sp.]
MAAQGSAEPLPEPQRQQILATVDKDAAELTTMAKAIWTYAELGYQETRSSALLQSELRKAGFTVRAGVAGMPTAFVASYRNGAGPVIGILAEFDALPGLSQAVAPEKSPVEGRDSGHGCGHNLFGAASVTAAIAVRDWMIANGVSGEIRLYGTPAEEGGSGKVFMVRDGLFGDVDAVLHWHPGDANGVSTGTSQANISGKFRFHGISSHASIAPEKGRSALDAVEVMNVAVNYMREHVPRETRIHYIITNGGQAPNVVPDFAESYYYVRHADPAEVRNVMARIHKAAEGAALATETTVEFEATGGVYSMLANETLAKVMDANLHLVGAPQWSAEEKQWAERLQKSLPAAQPLASAARINPLDGTPSQASTDVADISWVVPTVGLTVSTWVPGTPPHTWQAVAASGHSIGMKGGVIAAKTMALTAADLFLDPQALGKAKLELASRRGPGFVYSPMLGKRAPPLDYRVKDSRSGDSRSGQ